MCYILYRITIDCKSYDLQSYILSNTSIPTPLYIYEFVVNSTPTFSFKINASTNTDRAVLFLIGNGNNKVYAAIAVYASTYFTLKTLSGSALSPSSTLSGNVVTITTAAWDRCWVLSERALG